MFVIIILEKVITNSMDIDENDLLWSNQFVSEPVLEDSLPDEYNEEFRQYYKQEQDKQHVQKIKDNLERISLQSIPLDEETDSYSILQTHKFDKAIPEQQSQVEIPRKSRLQKTYVSVDSRDRDKIKFTMPNSFEIFLGRTFYNVQEIRLASVEFPNTNAVINKNNNMIYWRNQEDIDLDIIDNITKTYPVYSVELRVGSYTASTLQSEITRKLSSIKRKNKTGDFHYFDVKLDIDTDIVTLTSLILTQAPNNPITVTSGLGLITVSVPSHGYSTGDIIYLVGAKTLAGIPSSVLNIAHEVTVINNNTFQFEVNVKAGETATGGGNTVQTGRLAPFQLLFGENTKTVAPNVGFPLENSSQRIDSYIQSMVNFYQLRIVTLQKHNFANSYSFIGQTCVLSGTLTSPLIDGNRVITKIVNDTTFLVSFNSKIDFSVFGQGQVTFGGSTYDIVSIANNDIDTVLVTTFTNHNMELDDIGISLTLYDTISVPSLTGTHTLYGLLNDTTYIIPGSLLAGGDVNVVTPGAGGSMPHHSPLQTECRTITAVVPGVITTITCPNHNLRVGDRVKFFNIVTTPPLSSVSSGIHTIYTVIDSDTFTIDFTTIAVDNDVVNRGEALIGFATVTVSFPYHGFNSVTSIVAIPPDIDGYNVEVTTTLPHNLVTGNSVRIMKTNCVPVIDGGQYIVKVVDIDTFTIEVLGGGITSPGTSGIIGMSNELYVYGAEEVGGIAATDINNTIFEVRDIIDEHSFTFVSNSFANTTTRGGGSNIFISSLKHGFSGIQDNTKNSVLNRSINLEGENYVFLCCPQLATMMNTGSVKDIFARVTLDQSPGAVVFNYLSNPKIFNTVPLNLLSDLNLHVVNYDGSYYDFNDLDWSCVFEVTEVLDTTDGFNYSSRRGIVK